MKQMIGDARQHVGEVRILIDSVQLCRAAKLNGIDPEAYLGYVLARIADHSLQQIDLLLRWSTPVRRTIPADESD